MARKQTVVSRFAASVAFVLIASAAFEVSAHPVRIGRFTEIPYGVRPSHPYPTDRGGSRRNGRIRGRVSTTQPTRVWEVNLEHARPRGPTVADDGTLFLGTMGGLTARRPDGTELWFVRLGGPVHTTPSIAPSDDLIVSTRGGTVAAVTPEGVVRARAELGAPARGSPLVLDDGSILIGTIDGAVHRLDANLRRVFRTELAGGAASTLSVVRRGLLAAPAGGVLNLLTVEGGLVRQVSLGARATSPPAIADDGTIWVTTVLGVLHAIEPSGRSRSRTELGSRHYDGAAPAIGRDGAVRVPTVSEGIVCVGAGGTERWRLPSSAGFHAPASIDEDDTTLVSDRGGRLLAINADGTERWRIVIGTFSHQPPVLGPDGTLYVSTDRGQLQAWR